MTYWQKRAQAIDWAVENVLAVRSAVGPAYDEWDLRRYAAKLEARTHGTRREAQVLALHLDQMERLEDSRTRPGCLASLGRSK